MARLYLGTSGWAYPEWKGTFYPERIKPEEMLPFYAGHFDTVEVNNSFYRMPQPGAVEKWRDAVPSDFRFAYKGFRGIVHRKRFSDDTEILDRFAALLGPVGERLGPVMFQFETIADVAQLATFLSNAKARFKQVVVEFRHRSWLTEATFEAVRSADTALCQTETDEGRDPDLPARGFAYVRLRKNDYALEELIAWKQKLESMVAAGRDVYCFLKHEGQYAMMAADIFRRAA